MAKNLKEQTRGVKTITEDAPFIPPKFQHLAAIAVIYLSIVVFFHAMVFEGKKYTSADSIPTWTTFLSDAQKEGYPALWNPYIFCGFPGYAALSYPIPEAYDITTTLWEKVGREVLSYLFFKEGKTGANLLFYLLYGIGMYFLAYRFLKNKPIAVIVALMAVYATYIALLIMMGHITKLAVLAIFPFVFFIVDKLREKFNLVLALLLPLCVRVMLQPGHMQYIFYIYLALGIYFLYFLIRSFVKKESVKNVLASGVTLLLATGIAFLMGATQHFSTLEYNPYSIRGASPIQTEVSNSDNKVAAGGLDYKYATDYSFTPGEIMTFLIPSWYGFGPLPYKGLLTQNQETHLYLYLGPSPIVDGPQYMGIITIVLAGIGFFRNRKHPLVQYLGIVSIVALFLSFGREFPLLYDLMFKYFPMFNKFRVPVLILMLVQFCIPLLAGYGIVSFLQFTKKGIDPIHAKYWKYLFLGFAGALLVSVIGKDLIKSIYSSFFPLQEVGRILARSYGQLDPAIVSILYDHIFSSVSTDITIGVTLLLIVFGLFYLYQKGKIRQPLLYSVLVIVVLIDLWRVAMKPHDPVTHQEAESVIAKPGYVDLLLQDTTQFRVLKLANGQPVYDNSLALWRLYSAYGYHGAKMRIYQDMLDVAGITNPLIWQLMNVKYIITNREESNPMLAEVYKEKDARVYTFRYSLPHVFFVNTSSVADSVTILKNIAALSFDPRKVAYVQEQLKTTIDPPNDSAQVYLVKYGTQDLEVRVHATGNNLLFLSDTYYPKGWKASIDNNETEILRLNYLFRGVVIPPGIHTLKMKFEPQMFYFGKQVSFWITSLIYCVLIGAGILYWKKQRVKIIPST
jgi:hypothetical protein